MRTNTLVVLIAIAMLGGSSMAMAKGGGGGSGGSGISHGMSHGHFFHRFHRFPRNPVFFGDGWGWGWGPYSGDGANTTVFVQQSVPRFPAADLTGSTPATRVTGMRKHSRCPPQGRNGASPGRELPLNLSACNGASVGAN